MTESQSKIGYLASGAALAAYCFHSPTRRLVNGLLTNMAAAVGSAALQFHSPMLMREERMKKWRAGLSLMQRIDWARKGVLGGAELSQADAPVYDAELERHLVEAQPGGASVQRCEMIWMRHANGGWMLLPALLSSGISECLVIPATVAHELGYASEAGEPYRQYRPWWAGPTTTVITTGGEREEWKRLTNVTFSIAGREMSDSVLVRPPPRDLMCTLAEGLSGYGRYVFVPATAIRRLQDEGVQFRV